MEIRRTEMRLASTRGLEFIDITKKVEEALSLLGISEGVAFLSTTHTTTSICVNESCDRLQKDMEELLERLAPADKDYRHNEATVDNRPNARSHLLSLLLKTTETFQIKEGKPLLGGWQSIFFIELDGPRESRTLNLTVMGIK